jgi:hypothetical protein
VKKALSDEHDISVLSVATIGNSPLRIATEEQSNSDDCSGTIHRILMPDGNFAVALSGRSKESKFIKVKDHMRNVVRVTQRQDRLRRVKRLVTTAPVAHRFGFRFAGFG